MQAPPPVASYTPFDWFLVLVLVISTLDALQKGLIRVLFSIVGLVVAVVVASWEYEVLALWLHQWIVSFEAAEVVAFLAVLFLVTLAFGIVANVLRKTVKAIGLGFVDRLLGAGVGLIRGLLLGVAAMMAVTAFLPQSAWVKNSQLAPYFLGSVHAVSFVVPEHFQQQISSGARYLMHETPDLFRPHTFLQHR
jgi:membrane protein required for colicin V production